MSGIDKFNICKIAEESLKENLVDAITQNIMIELIGEFKKMAEPEVKRQAEKISIGAVAQFRDLANLRDEIKVYCEFKK